MVVDVLVVVLVVVVEVVEVVVVVVGPVTDTVQPTEPVIAMALPPVSNRLRTVSPMGASVLEEATTPKVTMATLTTPVGPARLVVCKPEIRVWQLLPLHTFLLLVGVVENSAVDPPATETTVNRVPS